MSRSNCLSLFLCSLCLGILTIGELPIIVGAESEPSTAESSTEEPTTPDAGHSYHGVAFNEGPRQAAYLMSGTGNVHFPATCANEQVQKFIDQGIGQLHGFWFFEAERSFRQAAALDPECAIAYWGMAMANLSEGERARGFIQMALERKENATPRERMYIEAYDKLLREPKRKQDEKPDPEKEKEETKKKRQSLVKDLEEILHEYPDDLEAKALLCLTLYLNRSKGIPISSYYAVDALLKQILAENPLHPCHHFVIHLWDYEQPELALESAARCGASAPAIAHMWHMPGHIYSRLKRYHDAVWQQEASARTDHAYMMRDRVMPDQIHNFAHNNEWLISNLIFLGHAHEALSLAKNMIDLPRHPKYNTLEKRGSAKYGRMRLMGTLSAFQLWEETIALADTIYLEPTDDEEEKRNRDVLIAAAMFQTGNVLRACETLTELKLEFARVEAERDQAGETAVEKVKDREKKSEAELKKVSEAARRKFATRLRKLNQAIHELEGHLHYVHRAYADAYESFKSVPGFDKGWLAMIRLQAGEQEKAIEDVKKYVDSRENETIPLAWQIAILHKANDKENARKAFDQLRSLSDGLALDAPVFRMLEPIAREFGFDADWRQPRVIPEDFGERPDLEQLGPFRWSPSPAPKFTLQDHLQNSYALADYKGRPVVVIFYLGYGCLQCAEQLQAFAPMTKKFADAGISLIAISTDDHAALIQSHENYDDGEFPFPLVSDAQLKVFKAYRCYDDFEEQTLHGTFLIDGDGRIRWQDISYEPFMDAEFVLQESQRLLSQPTATPATSSDLTKLP